MPAVAIQRNVFGHGSNEEALPNLSLSTSPSSPKSNLHPPVLPDIDLTGKNCMRPSEGDEAGSVSVATQAKLATFHGQGSSKVTPVTCTLPLSDGMTADAIRFDKTRQDFLESRSRFVSDVSRILRGDIIAAMPFVRRGMVVEEESEDCLEFGDRMRWGRDAVEARPGHLQGLNLQWVIFRIRLAAFTAPACHLQHSASPTLRDEKDRILCFASTGMSLCSTLYSRLDYQGRRNNWQPQAVSKAH
ncbi:uncharacterized protein LY89DRAFT_664789 [Mollisia scopiformis]|uniref:Uncharacterized protein n=1 Tax=Mollisia scopiformis TaxID=149040 RepID=A0A194XN63_MOLSC|nr:uncharacterized protein LY89DRAFT_664789 [Mollisia scopiformis]KUJ21608.1 hypothetical protein LY89DRAFT_664789 [Mollisia scopiformis]